MNNLIWLSVEEVCELTGEVKETVRRKCKRGEYSCTYKKEGKFKIYSINLDSLPEAAKNKYYGIKINSKHSKFYKESPAWAKKQAKKYVELIEKTKGMKHKEILEFLQDWNEKYPDKKSSYPALCKARIKYEQFGEDALLSKKGFKQDKYCINPDYYNYYKNLYLSSKGLSAIECWMQTLNYAKSKDKIKTANFPCEKTFDRLLKKEYTPEQIKNIRHRYEKVIAKDYSNIMANEYWIIEICQLKFPIKYKNKHFYPWLTVVKDVKTEKWLGWFVLHETVNSGHIMQAVYYALIKYGSPYKIFIKNTHFEGYISQTGKFKKTKIDCNNKELLPLRIYTNATYSYNIPANVNTTSVNYDLREFVPPASDINIFDFKEILDYHIQTTINQRAHRNQLFKGKSPNEFWTENYIPQKLPKKEDLIEMCLITKNPLIPQKNGIYDSLTDRNYWGDWLPLCTTKSMYLIRDIYSKDDGYLYSGTDQRRIGSVYILKGISALHQTEEEREMLRKAMERKKRVLKNIKSRIKKQTQISIEEKIENYKALYNQNIPEPEYNTTIVNFNSNIEKALEIVKKQEKMKKLQNEFYSKLAADLDNT